MTIKIASLDHLVSTAGDLATTIAFYTDVLGMEHVEFDDGLHAVHFGGQNSISMTGRATCRPRRRMSFPDRPISVSYLRHLSRR
jgi:catechol 2,3-dioxygenase-like lactoylglutathione lyase family enzyme